MDKRSNNLVIDPKKTLSEGELFFAQRWWELLDVSTHDNHYVNCLNLHIALVELWNTCKDILEGETYKWHLDSVVKETREIAKNDPVIQLHAPHYYNILIKSLQNTPQQDKEIYKLYLQLNLIVKYIESRYIKWLIVQLNKEIKNTNFFKIDSLVNCLISELIYRGWSINTLFNLIKKEDFYKKNYWRSVFVNFLKSKQKYICLIKINTEINEKFIDACSYVGLNILDGNNIVRKYPIPGLENVISNNSKYYIEEVEAYERNSAINRYIEQFVRKEDVLRFYGYKSPKVAQNATIISEKELKFVTGVQIPKFSSSLSPVALEKPLEFASKLPPEPMNLMQKVYRQCRQAEESPSAESCFLNIWVALESFTKTDEYSEKESDFVRIRDNVSSAVAMGYIFNLVRYFLADCKRCQVYLQGIMTLSDNTHLDTTKLVKVLLDSTKNSKLLSECQIKNTLLGYRCEQLINLLGDPKKVSEKIRNHSRRVQWHLQRMYRVRNSIVHSANHDNQNLNLLIRHLNSYLRSTVNGSIFYLYKTNSTNFDEIFYTMKQNYEATVDLLNEGNIKSNIEMYLKILIDGALFFDEK